MLIINQDAALFLLGQIAKNPDCKQPLRLKEIQKGCGDIAHKFSHAPVVLPGDSVVEAFGLTIVCNFAHFPDFENAVVALVANAGSPLAPQKIVVIPEGAYLCGCGESAAMPKK